MPWLKIIYCADEPISSQWSSIGFLILTIFNSLIPGRHQQPSSPFKRPLGLGHLANANNGSLSENSSCTSSSSGSGLAAVSGSLQVVDHGDHGFHSGLLPTIADVRSPDVLHPKHGPCDCLTHPLHVRPIHLLYSKEPQLDVPTGTLRFVPWCRLSCCRMNRETWVCQLFFHVGLQLQIDKCRSI